MNQTALRSAFLVLACWLAWPLPAAAQVDISETPLAVKNNVAPNIMFMIDNSGSMSNIVPESPYDDSVIYLASCPATHTAPGGFTNPKVPGATSYDLFVRPTGVTRFGTGGRDGATSTSRIFGATGANGTFHCFAPNLYYNFRLYADTHDSDCNTFGSGTTECRYPGTGYLDSVYRGNYLNWYFGAAPGYTSAANLGYTTTDARKTGTKTRMEIARTAAKTTVNTLPLPTGGANPKVRIGLSRYNDGDGGRLLRGMGALTSTERTAFNTTVDAISPSGNTPLAETLADIGHYFSIPFTGNLSVKGTNVTVANFFRQGSTLPHRLVSAPTSCTTGGATPTCPVQYWCQRNYAILLTDGRPQGDQALSTNPTLRDYDGDCTGSPPPIACDTIAGFDRKKQHPDGSLHPGHIGGIHTYESQGSDYLDDVAQALFETDLRPDLTAPAGRVKKTNVRTYTIGFADYQVIDEPLLAEAAAQGGGLYLTATDTDTLVARLKFAVEDALAKDGASAAVAVVNTQITVDNTAYASKYNSGYWTGDLEAFGLDTTTGLPIEPAYWSAQARLEARASPAANRRIVGWTGSAGVPFTAANAASLGLTANLINYIRGDRSLEGSTYRVRNKLLGDIVNAEPVVVKYGTQPIIFQGANDGMLHVFDGSKSGATAGQELWAYVPRLLHGKLAGYADPNYTHSFFVDATPAWADVGSTKWLVGGLGAGGKGYYALDITSFSASDEAGYATKPKWEFSHAGLGLSYGTPLIVNTAHGWRVAVPSGYNSASGGGKVFLLDLANGSIRDTIDTGTSGDAGLAHLAKSNALGAGDVVRHIYGGDLYGNVWRFDLESRSATRIAILTDAAGSPQPVSTPPAVGPATGATRNFVFVGTGLYLGDSDIATNTPHNAFSTQTQSMYGIIDDTSITTPALPNIRGTNGATCPADGGNGELVCQTATAATPSIPSTFTAHPIGGKRGWYWDIPVINGTRGRVVTAPQLTGGGAIGMTLNMPTNELCNPGGSSAFVNVDGRNGGAIPTPDDMFHESMVFLGYALASRPVIIDTADGKRAVIRLSDQEYRSPRLHEPPPPNATAAPAPWRRIYWRELK